uniref:Uncharacterized protein n=1 Tax=Anguilla anguilla TaxID=7936 RepID=A0A0E9QX64_ANGAN
MFPKISVEKISPSALNSYIVNKNSSSEAHWILTLNTIVPLAWMTFKFVLFCY